jgi:hypothetical protein
MGNAIKLLKTRILKLPGHLTEADAKKSLIEDIDKFIQVRQAFQELARNADQLCGIGKPELCADGSSYLSASLAAM